MRLEVEQFEKIFKLLNDSTTLIQIKNVINNRIREVAANVLKPYTNKIIYELDVLGNIWDLTGDTSGFVDSKDNSILVSASGPFKGKPFCFMELDRYLGRKVEHPITGVGILSKVNNQYCIAHSIKCANSDCKKEVMLYQVMGGASKSCFRYGYYDKKLKERIDIGEYRILCKKCRHKS